MLVDLHISDTNGLWRARTWTAHLTDRDILRYNKTKSTVHASDNCFDLGNITNLKHQSVNNLVMASLHYFHLSGSIYQYGTVVFKGSHEYTH